MKSFASKQKWSFNKSATIGLHNRQHIHLNLATQSTFPTANMLNIILTCNTTALYYEKILYSRYIKPLYDYVSSVYWRNENFVCVNCDVFLAILQHLLLAIIVLNFIGAYASEWKRPLWQSTLRQGCLSTHVL